MPISGQLSTGCIGVGVGRKRGSVVAPAQPSPGSWQFQHLPSLPTTWGLALGQGESRLLAFCIQQKAGLLLLCHQKCWLWASQHTSTLGGEKRDCGSSYRIKLDLTPQQLKEVTVLTPALPRVSLGCSFSRLAGVSPGNNPKVQII